MSRPTIYPEGADYMSHPVNRHTTSFKKHRRKLNALGFPITKKEVLRRKLTNKALQTTFALYPDDLDDWFYAERPVIDKIEVMARSMTIEAINYIKSSTFVSTSLPQSIDNSNDHFPLIPGEPVWRDNEPDDNDLHPSDLNPDNITTVTNLPDDDLHRSDPPSFTDLDPNE